MTPTDAKDPPTYAVRVMNPPGNDNAAFLVSTLLVDATTGAILGEARPVPSDAQPDVTPLTRTPEDADGGRDLRRRTWRRRRAGLACVRSAAIWLLGLLLAPLGSAAAGGAEVTLDQHGGPVKGIAVAADGERALTASFDYSLILWDLPHQMAIRQLYGHEAAVNAAAFLPGGKTAVSASDDGTVGLWDLSTGRLEARLAGHQGKVTAIAVSADGRLAASAGWDRTVRLWDLGQRTELRALKTEDNVNAVRFTPDGRRLLAGESDGSLQIWRVADGTPLGAHQGARFRGHGARPRAGLAGSR